ncbi:YtxH domain-containing protein [Priestia koreensis]|uniref:YtxH domain-containing protein n=1 Tax=Priestia koreensis TaxID=284581 RepID=UPI00203B659A|nr:YtxH domain-containing protein [Priestia koreensis]MCM3002829.1 YtxH domain-containing protein [Priestia koreensis]
MAKNNTNTTKNKDFVVGAIVGGVVGAATALLLAPKAGRELRSDINEQATFVRLKTEKLRNSAMEKGQGLASSAKDKTVSLSQTISGQSAQVINKVKGIRKKEEVLSESSLNVLEDEVETQSIEKEYNVQQELDQTKKALDEMEQGLKH